MSVFIEGNLRAHAAEGTAGCLACGLAKEAAVRGRSRRESIALNSGSVQGYYALTEREREILHKLNSGMSRGEIAVSFGISQNTVKSHLKNIYSKLGVRTRSEAYKASECECGGMGGIA